MANLRVLCELNMTSGIATDKVVNTWHVTGPTTEQDQINLVTAWKNFLLAIDEMFPETVAAGGHNVKIYNLADAEPRAAIRDEPVSGLTIPAVDGLPSEMAICISYQGNRQSGVDQARRRGRMYIGPLRVSTCDTGYVADSYVTLLINAFTDFVDELGTYGFTFVVYSRMDEAFVEVTNGWIDNAFDVQRRRGVDPTARTTFAV